MRVNWVLFQSFTFQNLQQWPRLLDCRKSVSIFKDKMLISFYRKDFENDSSTVKMCQMCNFFSTRKSQHFFRVWRINFWNICEICVAPFALAHWQEKGLISKDTAWHPNISFLKSSFQSHSSFLVKFWASKHSKQWCSKFLTIFQLVKEKLWFKIHGN